MNKDVNSHIMVEEKLQNIVYILINAAMPDYVKIGITSDLKQRLKQLSNTSVPFPFQVVVAKKVKNARLIETKIHKAFSKYHIDSGAGREFFTIAPEEAAAILDIADGEYINIDEKKVNTKQEEEALNKVTKNRRAAFTFSSVGIPAGSILTFSTDQLITCKVIDDRRVEYNGEKVFLSDAADQVLKSKGINWKAVSGPGIWEFENETLHNRRIRLEQG